MNKAIIESIVQCMPAAADQEQSNIQKVQTEHRIKLAEFWGIKEGSKVLEIGCGQGDTTAVLAYFAGKNGMVHGIDAASPTYGAPVSLGDSAKFLLQSPLGKQIRIDFGINILSQDIEYKENFFDYIVFSHCSWYLGSFDELHDLMVKVKKWGKQLCFAEWDTRIHNIDQYPHLLSALIQAQYESFKHHSDSNIRTMFTADDIKTNVENAGWRIEKEAAIVSPKLQDAAWEINHVCHHIDDEQLLASDDMPVKLKRLIQSELYLLKEFKRTNQIRPLPVYAFIAAKQ